MGEELSKSICGLPGASAEYQLDGPKPDLAEPFSCSKGLKFMHLETMLAGNDIICITNMVVHLKEREQ